MSEITFELKWKVEVKKCNEKVPCVKGSLCSFILFYFIIICSMQFCMQPVTF